MSTQESSRGNQRRRTRADLIRAARGLMENGGSPTVAEVADAAGISRATAYRYFSKPEDLERETMLDAIATLAVSMPEAPGRLEDVPAAVDELVRKVFALVSDNEALFRRFLATSVSADSEPPRGGRRLEWARQTVAPLRATVGDEAGERLVAGLALLTGIETLVVLRDVCQLDGAEAEAVVRWAAAAMVRHAGNPGA